MLFEATEYSINMQNSERFRFLRNAEPFYLYGAVLMNCLCLQTYF